MPQFIYTMKGLGKVHQPDHVVLKDIWLSFLPGAKIGVLGGNGAGKSTLLRIMAGEDTSFIGEAFPAGGISVGFLPQEPRLDPTKNVLANVEEGVAEVRALLNRYDEINAKFAEDLAADEMDKVLEEQGKIQDRIEAANGWDLDSRLELAMDALRLPPADAEVATLSGGERRRVALCRLLLRSPDLLLLDEPTNHLDAESVAWLERFLKDYPGTVVAVTHDRYFLDNVAGWILELDRGSGIPWEGNYSSWLDQKQQRLQLEEKQESKRQRTLQRELEWIRMSPRARQAKGKARLNAYEDLLKEDTAQKIEQVEIYIPPGPRLGDHRCRGAGTAKVVRGPRADGRRGVHASPRRHRRRNRSQRRRQDDAFPDDHRAGAAGRRNAPAGRNRPHRLRRSVTRCAWRRQDRVGRDHRCAATKWSSVSAPSRRAPTSRGSTSRDAISSARSVSLSGGERNRVHLAKLLKGGRTCCFSTSRPTTSTSTRCARSKRRCSRLPAAPSSSATTGGSSIASPRTCWRSKGTARSCGSRGTTRTTRPIAIVGSAPRPISRTASSTGSSHDKEGQGNDEAMKCALLISCVRVLLSFLLVFLVCACEWRPTARFLSIATGGTGGVYYPYGGGLAKVLNENLPGVRATAEVTSASVDNLKLDS